MAIIIYLYVKKREKTIFIINFICFSAYNEIKINIELFYEQSENEIKTPAPIQYWYEICFVQIHAKQNINNNFADNICAFFVKYDKMQAYCTQYTLIHQT